MRFAGPLNPYKVVLSNDLVIEVIELRHIDVLKLLGQLVPFRVLDQVK